MRVKHTKTIKNLLKRAKYRFSHRLPIYEEQLEPFIKNIFDTYSLPDHPTYRHAIATAILHMPSERDRMPISYFAKSIRKAMASQISYNLLVKLKEQEEAKKLEATQNSISESDVALNAKTQIT